MIDNPTAGDEDDEAMEAASNVMETTTNDSHSSSSNSVTMEDAASADDIAMDQGDEDDEMVGGSAAVPLRNQDVERIEVDEIMQDKSRPVEGKDHDDIMKTSGSDKDEAKETANVDETPTASVKVSLHDSLALGEIELGLERQRQLQVKETDDEEGGKQSQDKKHQTAVLQIQRLPYILRLLSSTRPLASISMTLSSSGNILHTTDDNPQRDALVDAVVDKLEDVAAMYSVAEGVDVATNHLAGSVTKKLSRLKPLPKRLSIIDGEEVIEWDTSMLAEVARNPLSHSSKRKRDANDDIAGDASLPVKESLVAADSDVDVLEDNEVPPAVPLKQLKSSHRRHSMEVAAEDSQEATFVKTASEFVSLIVKSLDRYGSASASQDADDEPNSSGGKAEATFALKTDDSILLEGGRGADEETGGAMEGSDLGSTIANIMHYAPVLRSNHVASAICRSSLPGAGDLLTRVGANCPTTVPSLLLGCIETYVKAIKYGNKPISRTAKQGVIALANLSRMECAKVFYKLQSLDVMVDVQMKIAMELGLITFFCLIMRHLSTYLGERETTAGASIYSTVQAPIERQLSRESSADNPENENEDLGAPGPSSGCEPTLEEYFVNDRSLYEKTLSFYCKEIENQNGSFMRSKGQWGIGLRSLSLVLLVPVTDKGNLTKRNELHLTLLKSFEAFLDRDDAPFAKGRKDLPNEAETDNIFGIMTSCVILLCVRILGIAAFDDRTVDDLCARMMKQTKRLEATSRLLRRHRGAIGYAVKTQSTWDLFQAATRPLLSSTNGCGNRRSYESMLLGLKKLLFLMDATDFDDTDDSLLPISTPKTAGQRKDPTENSLEAAETETILTRLLLDKPSKKDASLDFNVDILRFIKDATKLLAKEGKSRIPIVAPSILDLTWSRVTSSNGSRSRGDLAIYILRLLYSLEFLDANSRPLFAVDPRSLPLREILIYAERLLSQPEKNFFFAELFRLLENHAPETIVELHYEEGDSADATSFGTGARNEEIESIYTALIQSVANSKAEDSGEASNLEPLFLRARSRISDADLYTTVVSAFLSSPHNPSPTFSYGVLCRDPVVVFRCPLYVWSCKSLRRILLTTLRALLMANNVIAVQESPAGDVAKELLVARDAIIVRSLFSVLHRGGSDNSCICSMTQSFVRWLISRRPGLVALLVKQGLDERDLDWLVEHVPETMSDWEFLASVLGKSCSTAAERLVAADAISRIAIVYGGDSNEQEAAKISSGALSELVDSFYLIIGPVGVPVNVLLSDDSGTDITQISRKAAFRLLKALIRVRARRLAFQGCGAGLQKLALLCKGESAASGVQGAVAARRKQLLKEVFEATSKAVGISCQVLSAS